jgi:allophanate hydrolase
MDWLKLNSTIAGLSEHYKNQDFSPRELVEYLLTLEVEDSHNIWITRLNLAQLEPYLVNLEHISPASLPLYGVPFAIKDNIDLKSIDTTAGCETYRYQASDHANVVKHLIEAGAIPMGKTNLDQFATGLVGVRSPFGACKNAFNPDYISGGSSSGSAVATAIGLVSFALGTDTAGSGRVPAAFNNLIGVKPSRGLISCSGVVPACQSLDCVSIFALTVDDANQVLSIAEGFDAKDPYSRENTFDNKSRRYGQLKTPIKLGIPASKNLNFFGDIDAQQLFNKAIDDLRQTGYEVLEVDIQPLINAAKLLYQGPWVVERYIAIENLINDKPEALLPVIENIIGKGREFSGIDTFKAFYQLQHYKQQSELLFSYIDSLVTPTAPTCYTIAEVESDPINLNSRLGTYTNFMNLLDLSSIALPAGFFPSGVGFGITLQAPAFQDRLLLSLANSLCEDKNMMMGATNHPMPSSAFSSEFSQHYVDLVVCGAHLEGMPLNWQLTERQAIKQYSTSTATSYRLYAMQDGRPALFRDEQHGAGIEVEVWRLPKDQFGSFVADIPGPLGIGKVELTDGKWLPSFIAEPRALISAKDISHFQGWRNYIKSTKTEN